MKKQRPDRFVVGFAGNQCVISSRMTLERARGFIEEAELKKALVYELKEVSKNK